MSKKYKIILTILLTLLVISLCIFAIKKFVYDKDQAKNPNVQSSIVDKIDAYGYTLDDRDSELFKEKYYELKDTLQNEEIDYQKYAEQLSQLFIIDLFTINNKINKYDVGGLEYLYESEKEMFKNKVMDTLYEHVEDNSYDTRKQELPVVTNTIVNAIEQITYKIDNKELNAYEIEIFLNYKKDLGYDEKCKVTLVKDENKIYVVKYASIN